MRIRCFVLAVSVCLTIALTGPTARAANPPANDDCHGAISVVVGVTPFDSTCATAFLGDPLTCEMPTTATIWFTFTAATSNVHTADTCGTSYDTVLSVLEGPSACGPFTVHQCNDDNSAVCGAGSVSSEVAWCATAGTTYFIMVDSFDGSTGLGQLQVIDTGSPCTQPPNDSCASPTALPTHGPFPILGSEDTTGATSDLSDPLQSCGFVNQRSVWFAWIAPENGGASFETCDSTYDTTVVVFTGACGGLTEVVCNDDEFFGHCPGTLQSRVDWLCATGTPYLIRVSAYGTSGIGGTLQYALVCDVAAVGCRSGNINTGVGPQIDVLYVNGTPGFFPERYVTVTPTTPFTLDIQATPSGGTHYAMYVWGGLPDDSTLRTLPSGLGRSCMATPLSAGPRHPARIANNIGMASRLGIENWPGPRTLPAPYRLLDLPGGLGRTGTFFFEGLMLDPGASNGIAGVTNGIVVISR